MASGRKVNYCICVILLNIQFNSSYIRLRGKHEVIHNNKYIETLSNEWQNILLR